MNLERENRELREKISLLEEELIQLKRLLSSEDMKFPGVFKLSPGMRSVLTTLYVARGCVSKERLYQKYVTEIAQGEDQPYSNIIEVQLCKLRKVLKPYGITIDSIYRTGYMLTKDSLLILDEMLKNK